MDTVPQLLVRSIFRLLLLQKVLLQVVEGIGLRCCCKCMPSTISTGTNRFFTVPSPFIKDQSVVKGL
jgi:hypothetical protein